jgi:hypothetical protein
MVERLYLFVNEQPVQHISGYSRLLDHQFCELPVQTYLVILDIWLLSRLYLDILDYPTSLSPRLLFSLTWILLTSGPSRQCH